MLKTQELQAETQVVIKRVEREQERDLPPQFQPPPRKPAGVLKARMKAFSLLEDLGHPNIRKHGPKCRGKKHLAKVKNPQEFSSGQEEVIWVLQEEGLPSWGDPGAVPPFSGLSVSPCTVRALDKWPLISL